MKSAIYTGWVRHRRFSPREREFSYRVFMPFLNVEEIPEILDAAPGWSARRWAPARFCREDFLGDPAIPLNIAVQKYIFQATGKRHTGPVYLLANLRYFGFLINPICCYYCYDDEGENLLHIVLEVTNTPWNERHAYVLSDLDKNGGIRQRFPKALHVSPFLPMEMEYHLRSNAPGESLLVHLEDHGVEGKVFDATLMMKHQPLNGTSLSMQLLRFPFMTAKVAFAIYWQALVLWLKGFQFYTHPLKTTETTTNE